ncbi:death ligand signal enhancer [Nematolebias whitei]|uniref:death ligand signal enhancer n=1 Tax=Nematolebias whitei TaxID=451745 RepID=UPI00189AF0E6|nr:death ligand signal enhancer [Nematolebias whitei]
MWRVQGLFGRVLHRFHGSNSLRLPPNPHVEDEVISNSAALTSTRHPVDNRSQEDDGERRNKQRTFQFGFTELPHYTALDAVRWGAVAVLFMQVCRRVHSTLSSGSELNPSPGTLTAPLAVQKCGFRILLEILSRRDVLPKRRNVLCLQTVPKSQNQDQSPSQSSCSSERLTSDSFISDHQGELYYEEEESPFFEPCPLQNDANPNTTEKKDKEASEVRLAEAALHLGHVGDSSVPVILNIIGLESAKSEKYEEAFSCFLAAAQHGYSKAQFNTGVCYENGRGVRKNKTKALYYYRQAAAGGHKQAQYRSAKLLLTSRGQQSVEELNTAINLLEEASRAGLTKAQVCLASLYSRDPKRYGCKSVEYLRMAAESGDDTALFFLGQCYESGFGVQQNLRTAVEFYKKAAQAGNKRAKSLVTPPDTYSKEDAVLRSIRSAPCLSVAETLLQQPLSSLATHASSSSVSHPATPLLPHSWSTGNLSFSTPLHLHPPSTESGPCQWTVGIG